jgi:hypothetical protein
MRFLLTAGAIYHLCWATFDSFWPHLFAWKRTLAKLDDINRSLLYILSRLLVLLYLYVAFLSFFYHRELVDTALGKSFLIFVAVYWLYRALMQIQFFGFARANRMNITLAELNYPPPANRLSNQTASIAFFVIMLTGAALYIAPALSWFRT